jgi:2,3-bisphosphoglycerate-independent phosphoglycerate mutase
MDRDNRWDRVEKAYNAMVLAEGDKANSAVEAMEATYNNKVTDEFVLPTIIEENGEPVGQIKNGDSIICFNFRPDRAREITRTFIDPDFNGFERKTGLLDLKFVCMTQYDATFTNFKKCTVAFKPQTLTNTLGEYVSNKGLKQLRIAETEKYAHVTFFFNGGVEAPNPNEDRVLIPSPKVATYDLQPEMSAFELTDAVVDKINNADYDLIVLNYANSDMVGHTGIMEAAIKAVETVDTCLGKVVDAVLKKNGSLVIIADHGNSDQMVDYSNGEPFTAHTTNPVPLIVIGEGNVKLKEGKLADVAPTLLDMMGLEKPQEMTGASLIEK